MDVAVNDLPQTNQIRMKLKWNENEIYADVAVAGAAAFAAACCKNGSETRAAAETAARAAVTSAQISFLFHFKLK